MAKLYLLGLDIGSSSIKASLVDAATGEEVALAQSPKEEMPMLSRQPGWAEQEPETWWQHTISAVREVMSKVDHPEIVSIGIAYQMHGLVIVDKDYKPLRPSIIWCDSRAVSIGEKAFQGLGEKFCLEHLLNSPGNFTAAKLRWVQENEPEVYSKIHKAMLPGDYIALKLTGENATTASSLSEGIFWDFQSQHVCSEVMKYFNFSPSLLPAIVPTFSIQGSVRKEAADQLGIPVGVKVGYRAGDQPNNAFSVGALHSGESAATAGTSGVIYSVTDKPVMDEKSRVNTFVHVTNQRDHIRNGVLLCINGTGISNSWIRKTLQQSDYEKMNHQAGQIPIGANGVFVLPFGNGAERILENEILGASIHGLDYNQHSAAHVMRATQEGIVFALQYGFEIMREMGVESSLIKAGHANMFLSPLFREAFVNTVGVTVELMDTNGAKGAALGGGVGAGVYSTFEEAFKNIKVIATLQPEKQKQDQYQFAYDQWRNVLKKYIHE